MIQGFTSFIVFLFIPLLLVSSVACYVIFFTAKYRFKLELDFIKLIRYSSLLAVVLAMLLVAFYRNEDF